METPCWICLKMPFTAPLLSVAANQFDCLIENTGTYTQGASGGSSVQRRYSSTSDGFVVLSDPKNIVHSIINTTYEDYIRFNLTNDSAGSPHIITMTMIQNFNYTSGNSSDRAGFTEISISSSGGFAISGALPQYQTYGDGATKTLTDIQLDVDATIPGMVFKIFRAGSGETFTASGRLLIGLNKT